MKIEIIFCLSFGVLIKFAQAQYENTTNGCFFAQSKTIIGDEITTIPISGDELGGLLATCCLMCRALYHCVAWDYEVKDQTCAFYSKVTSISSNSNSYAGIYKVFIPNI